MHLIPRYMAGPTGAVQPAPIGAGLLPISQIPAPVLQVPPDFAQTFPSAIESFLPCSFLAGPLDPHRGQTPMQVYSSSPPQLLSLPVQTIGIATIPTTVVPAIPTTTAATTTATIIQPSPLEILATSSSTAQVPSKPSAPMHRQNQLC